MKVIFLSLPSQPPPFPPPPLCNGQWKQFCLPPTSPSLSLGIWSVKAVLSVLSEPPPPSLGIGQWKQFSLPPSPSPLLGIGQRKQFSLSPPSLSLSRNEAMKAVLCLPPPPPPPSPSLSELGNESNFPSQLFSLSSLWRRRKLKFEKLERT